MILSQPGSQADCKVEKCSGAESSNARLLPVGHIPQLSRVFC